MRAHVSRAVTVAGLLCLVLLTPQSTQAATVTTPLIFWGGLEALFAPFEQLASSYGLAAVASSEGPSAPQNLRPSGKVYYSVNFSYGAPADAGAGIKEYHVYRDGVLLSTGWKTLNANDTRWPEAGATYTYTVTAVDWAGHESPPSNPITIAVPQRPSLKSSYNIPVLLVDFQDWKDKNRPFTKDYVEQMMYTRERSVNTFIQDNTYGKSKITGEVYGWFTVPGNLADYAGRFLNGGLGYDINYPKLMKDLVSVADADVNFSGRDAVVVLLYGVGTAGESGYIAQTQEGTVSFVPISAHRGDKLTVPDIVHELGHKLWHLGHAGSSRCSGGLYFSTDVRDPQADGCWTGRYEDTTDVMGSYLRDLSSYHREKMGVLSSGQVAVANSSGTYTLDVLETPSSGIKELRMPVPHGGFLFAEYRRPVGFDGLPQSDVGGSGSGTVAPGVYVRMQPSYFSYDMDTLIPTRSIGSPVVFTPGHAFHDAARGITLEVTSMDAQYATIKVTRESTARDAPADPPPAEPPQPDGPSPDVTPPPPAPESPPADTEPPPDEPPPSSPRADGTAVTPPPTVTNDAAGEPPTTTDTGSATTGARSGAGSSGDVTPTPQPRARSSARNDLFIEELSLSSGKAATPVAAQSPLGFSLLVRNAGSNTATTFSVRLWVDEQSDGSWEHVVEIPSQALLKPGAPQRLFTGWVVPQAAPGTYAAEACVAIVNGTALTDMASHCRVLNLTVASAPVAPPTLGSTVLNAIKDSTYNTYHAILNFFGNRGQ